MFNLLVDTCVWFDVAKDPQQKATLDVLEGLIRQRALSLIVPNIIRDEFSRNKTRILQESQRSISSVLKRAKQVVDQLGDVKHKQLALAQLNDVDYKLPTLGENAVKSIGRVEKLLNDAAVMEISDTAKLRAADRAISKRAPFHSQRNSMADAVLMETYAERACGKSPGIRFAFVTHNTKDFSHPTGDNRLPHPDFAAYFSKRKSLYFISLSEALKRVKPALVSDLMLEHEWVEEDPRRLSEIVDVIGELIDKVWYNRHQVRMEMIESGEITLVEKETYPIRYDLPQTIQRDMWRGAQKSARRVEKQYGRKNLGPWSDFDWGMMNGKLSALRWVLGEEWDSLYT